MMAAALTPSGTASSDKLIESRSSRHVLANMTATIKILTTGSSLFHPVTMMIPPDTRTPAEIAASPSMWMKALRRFKSSWLPPCSIHAQRPFKTMPAAATPMTVAPTTGGGEARRSAASQPIAPQATSNNTALVSAASTVERPSP